ncbi:MAG: sulfurtransferase TusA family protein [Parvularculaceae bacterium]|nr:sulfurtransferase TusA family protein [Parvularculaceae bacterium]
MSRPDDASATLDLTGYRCPIPVVRTEAVLRGLPLGATLKVLADDPLAAVDLPHFCREAGHTVERLPSSPPLCVFLVTRGEKR